MSSTPSLPSGKFHYTVKVINARNQSGYTVQKLKTNTKFETFLDLENQLKQGCSNFPCDDEFQCGYIQRGHGQKGKQFLISGDSEITEMYAVYQGKQDIMLWMKVKSGNPRKRKQSSIAGEQAGSSKECTSSDIEDITPPPKQQKTTNSGSTVKGGTQYQKHLKKMSEVEVIIEYLEEKHSDGKYSAEQIRVWAHMLHMIHMPILPKNHSFVTQDLLKVAVLALALTECLLLRRYRCVQSYTAVR